MRKRLPNRQLAKLTKFLVIACILIYLLFGSLARLRELSYMERELSRLASQSFSADWTEGKEQDR